MSWQSKRNRLCSCRALDPSIVSVHLRSLDLRFSESEDEYAYVKGHEKILLRNALICSVCFTCAFMHHAFTLYSNEVRREDNAMKLFAFDDVRNIDLLLSVFFLIINTLYSFCLIVALVCGKLDQFNWEIVISAIYCILIFGNVFNSSMRHNPQWKNSSSPEAMELSVLVRLDAIITASCLFLPIRTCVLWIVPFFATACFICMNMFVGMHSTIILSPFLLFCLGIFSLAGSFRHEGHSRKDWLSSKEVERQARQNEVQHAGASRILGMLCDALVEVDADYNIRNPSTRFAALLLRSNMQSLEGTNFCDYLSSSDDRSRFISTLQNDTTDTKKRSGANGGMVQLSFRDSTRDFGAYVYHSLVFDSFGERGHMMAIVEAQERMPLPNPSDMPPLNASNISNGPLVYSSRSGSSSFDSFDSLENESLDEILAWLEPNEEGEPILSKVAVGFTVFGPVPLGTNLCDLVSQDVEDFRKWYQYLMNCHSYGEQPLISISVRLRTSQHASFEFQAKCKPHWESTEEKDPALCIMFSDVKTIRRRTKSTHRQRFRGEAARMTLNL